MEKNIQDILQNNRKKGNLNNEECMILENHILELEHKSALFEGKIERFTSLWNQIKNIDKDPNPKKAEKYLKETIEEIIKFH